MGVVEDMVASNADVFPEGKGPDHLVVIKYIPSVGDSKRAMDEYISSIGMGGINTLVIHNTCEVRNRNLSLAFDCLLINIRFVIIHMRRTLFSLLQSCSTSSSSWNSFNE